EYATEAEHAPSDTLHSRSPAPTLRTPYQPPPTAPPSPYTPLFRSVRRRARSAAAVLEFLDAAAELAPPARASSAAASRNSSTARSEEHTSELQSLRHLVCRRLLEKKNDRSMSTHVRHAASLPAAHR